MDSDSDAYSPDPDHMQERDLVSEIIKELKKIYAVKSREKFDIFALRYSGGELMQAFPMEILQANNQSKYTIIRAHSTMLPFRETLLLSEDGKASRVEVLWIVVSNYEHDVRNLKVRWKNSKLINFGTYLEMSIGDSGYKDTAAYRKTVGQHGFAALFEWYKATGKPFRFLDLPLELRLEVYSLCIGNDIYPKVIKRDGMTDIISVGRGWKPEAPLDDLDDTYDASEVVPAPNLVITSLSKQVRAEALDSVWKRARQSFAYWQDLTDIAPMTPTLPTHALNHIGLNLDSTGYIYFFGARLTMGSHSNYSSFALQPVSGVAPASVLSVRRLPNLTRLDINFQSTRWLLWTDPWISKAISRDPLHDMPFFRPCQKITTELILALALDYVYHIDKVTLEGDVKNSTNGNFERALREKKADPGCEPEWPITKTQIFNSDQFNRPPRCRCQWPCYPEESRKLHNTWDLNEDEEEMAKVEVQYFCFS